ncbi:MAG: nSTAND1 domain-containing NTPase [Gemmatimonadaceae bacterium]
MTGDPREARCPYPGLEAFTADNRQYFVGRERDTQLLISNLYAAPLTVVYGSSGVGKTSVILAGVVPEVEREGDAVIVVHRTWQDAARARSLGARMAEAVAGRTGHKPVNSGEPLDVVAQQLAVLARRPIFLVFDQFEEYFLHNEASDDAGSLDGELARLINGRDVQVHVMIVMREDSLAGLDRFRHRIPTLLNNLYRLEHLTREEAVRAIEEPLATLAGTPESADLPARIEPALAASILDDLATLDQGMTQGAGGRDTSRVELPFLQVVLERLWIAESRARSPLVRRATFSDAGGARGIVRQRIEESLNALGPGERGIVASVLRHLVTPSGAKIALTMADLSGYAGATTAEVEPVVQRLVSSESRVLRRVAHPSQESSLTKYEIYHDALGATLLAWRTEADRRRVEIERRGRRRVRDGIAGLALLAAIAVALVVVLQRGKSRVEAREIASVADGQLATDNGRAILLALMAIDRSGSEDAGETVLRRALFEPGERLQDTVGAGITQLVVSPDGRYVFAGGTQTDPALWTTDSLRRILLPRGLGLARNAVFDAASRRLLIVEGQRPTLLRLDSVVTAVRFSRSAGSIPDGHLMRDGTRVLLTHSPGLVEWTVTDSAWTETARLPSGSSATREVMVSPDERWAALRSFDDGVDLVQLDARPWSVRRYRPPGHRVSSMLWASSRSLAVAMNTDTVLVLDVATFDVSRVVRLSCAVSRIALSGGEAAGTCINGGIVLFNLPEMRSQARMGDEPPRVSSQGRDTTVFISPDGAYAVGLGAGELSPTVWSIFARREATRLRGHRSDVTALAFLPSSRGVITVGNDSTIRKWEIVSASQRVSDGEFMAGRATVSLNDSATRAGMVSPYGLQLWDIQHDSRLIERPFPEDVEVVAVAPNGNRIAIVGRSGVFEFTPNPDDSTVWVPGQAALNASRGDARTSLAGTSILRYTGSGDTLVLAANVIRRLGAGRAVTFDRHGELIRLARGGRRDVVLARFQNEISSLSVDSSGSLAAVGLEDNRVVVVSVRGDSTTAAAVTDSSWVHASAVRAVLFGPGGLLASAGSGEIKLASRNGRPSSGASVRPYGTPDSLGSHEVEVVQLAFNASGTVLASGDAGGTTRLWRTASRNALCSLDGQHADAVRAIAFSPSGRVVATADERGVALWFVDEAAGTCRFSYRLADLEAEPVAMRFTRDGAAFVVVGRDGISRRYLRAVWAPRDSLIALARRRLRGRTLLQKEKDRYVTFP